MADFELQVTVHGEIGDEVRAYAEEKVRRVARLAPRPVLVAHLDLKQETNPSIARAAVAKASLDVSGHLVRAHVAAERLVEAIDLLEERLRRRLEILQERRLAARSETGVSPPGEWRHGSLPAQRPSFFPRPAEEREVVRHKTFEVTEAEAEEAALDLELLDYDFHLFTNLTTGAENVVWRREDGSLELLDDPPTLPLEDAIERLNVSGEPFVFFCDAATGRGHLLYHRYDGHYGLIAPQDGRPSGGSG